jgi:hypothetical protein
MIVATARWLPRYDEIGELEPLLLASRRGVRVRFITEVTADNADFVKKYRRVFEIRHHQGVGQAVRLMLCDDSEVRFALSAPSENTKGTLSLVSDSAPLIEGFKSFLKYCGTTPCPRPGF